MLKNDARSIKREPLPGMLCKFVSPTEVQVVPLGVKYRVSNSHPLLDGLDYQVGSYDSNKLEVYAVLVREIGGF